MKAVRALGRDEILARFIDVTDLQAAMVVLGAEEAGEDREVELRERITACTSSCSKVAVLHRPDETHAPSPPEVYAILLHKQPKSTTRTPWPHAGWMGSAVSTSLSTSSAGSHAGKGSLSRHQPEGPAAISFWVERAFDFREVDLRAVVLHPRGRANPGTHRGAEVVVQLMEYRDPRALHRSAALLKKRNSAPESGSCRSTSRTTAARPSNDRRKSSGSVAT